MKITFLLPSIDLSGGVKAVFEFANYLSNRNHEVCVMYPATPVKFQRRRFFRWVWFLREKFIFRKKTETKLSWFNLKARLRCVPTLEGKYIPDADLIVATWWETAFCVHEYGPEKGAKFYLAQHYEIWGGRARDVNRSYQLGLNIIVNSAWLWHILEAHLKVHPVALILHAPDFDHFYCEKPQRKVGGKRVRVLMPYRDIPWKGVADGLAAFSLAATMFPDIQLVMFGHKKGGGIPDWAEFHYDPSNDKLRAIYNSCDIFLFPSHCEGFGMPPLEAMACGCAVVTTNVGAVPDYAVHGETAMISPPRRPDLLGANIIALLTDQKLLQKIADAGRKHVLENFSWAKATTQLENVFKEKLSCRLN